MRYGAAVASMGGEWREEEKSDKRLTAIYDVYAIGHHPINAIDGFRLASFRLDPGSIDRHFLSNYSPYVIL